MRRGIWTLALALLALLLLGGGPAAAVTGNGEPDDGTYSNVGAVIARVTDKDGGIEYWMVCSGTLIAPDVFLTAAHCLTGFPDYVQIVGVTFDSEVIEGESEYTGTLYPIAEGGIAVHPDYLAGDSVYNPYVDIGVILLEEPITHIEPAALPEIGALDSWTTQRGRTREDLIIVGYGYGSYLPSRSPVHEIEEAGVRRTGEAQLININRGVAGDTLIQFTNSRGEGRSGTCYGDSGGSLFLEDGTLIAITSGGNNKHCLGGWGIDYRLDTEEAHAFLEDYVGLPGETDSDATLDVAATTGDAQPSEEQAVVPAEETAPESAPGNGNANANAAGNGNAGGNGQATAPGQASAAPAEQVAAPVDLPAEAPADVPVVDAPPVDVPVADAPPVELPVADAPPVDTPPVEAPVVEPPADATEEQVLDSAPGKSGDAGANGKGHGRANAPGQGG